MKTFEAQIQGEEKITLTLNDQDCLIELKALGSLNLLNSIQNYKKYKNALITQVPIPTGNTREDILLREVLLKSQNQWKFPYEHDELCHCRKIETKKVDEAIILGARTPEEVSRLTSASTACGTCRPHVEDIIKFRTEF